MPQPVVLAVLIAVAAGTLILVVRARTPAPVPVEVVEATPEPTAPPLIVVDVEGAVARPGVVKLASGARVADALAAAGETTPDADPAALNKAATLRDGARVRAPLRRAAGGEYRKRVGAQGRHHQARYAG